MKEQYVRWYDGFGNEHRDRVLSTFSRTNEAHGLTRSWVTVWDERRWEPRWLDIRECEDITEEMKRM